MRLSRRCLKGTRGADSWPWGLSSRRLIGMRKWFLMRGFVDFVYTDVRKKREEGRERGRKGEKGGGGRRGRKMGRSGRKRGEGKRREKGEREGGRWGEREIGGVRVTESDDEDEPVLENEGKGESEDKSKDKGEDKGESKDEGET